MSGSALTDLLSPRSPRPALRGLVWAACIALATAVVAGEKAPVPGEPKAQTGPDLAPLEAWRSVQKVCEKAVKAGSVSDRIRGCEEFLAQHADHQGRDQLLKTLVDSYLETGDYDPDRVAELLEARAALDPNSHHTPLSIVQDYYVKHGLPLESAQRLLAVAAERREKERKKLARLVDPKERRREERNLDYYAAQALAAEGRLRLEHGDTRGAIVSLQAALGSREKFPRGVAVYEGETEVDRLSTGLLESVDLALAVAYSRLGEEDKACSAYKGSLGFFSSNKQLKELQEELVSSLDWNRP